MVLEAVCDAAVLSAQPPSDAGEASSPVARTTAPCPGGEEAKATLEGSSHHFYPATQRRARRSLESRAREIKRSSLASTLKLDDTGSPLHVEVRGLPGSSALRRSLSASFAGPMAVVGCAPASPGTSPLAIRTLRRPPAGDAKATAEDLEAAQAYDDAMAAHARVKDLAHKNLLSSAIAPLLHDQADELCQPQVLRSTAAAIAAVELDLGGAEESIVYDWSQSPTEAVHTGTGHRVTILTPRAARALRADLRAKRSSLTSPQAKDQVIGCDLLPSPPSAVAPPIRGALAEPCPEPAAGPSSSCGASVEAPAAPTTTATRAFTLTLRPQRPGDGPPSGCQRKKRGKDAVQPAVPPEHGIDLRFVSRPETATTGPFPQARSLPRRPFSAGASRSRSEPTLAVDSVRRWPSTAGAAGRPARRCPRDMAIRGIGGELWPKAPVHGDFAATTAAGAAGDRKRPSSAPAGRGQVARLAAAKRGAAAGCAKQRDAWGK